MKVLFLHSDKPRERVLAEAFLDGVKAGGDVGEMRPLVQGAEADTSFDVACMVGVKSKEIFDSNAQAGLRIVYFDKGYCRQKAATATKSWEYWRVAVGAHQPTRYLMSEPRPRDRLDELGLICRPWREPGDGHIVLAGSSAKYHSFYGLSDPTRWAKKVVKELRRFTDRPIVYRPKPSWADAVPIEGTRFSDGTETIIDVLHGAHAVITHGSNACFESVLAGVPCVVLGEAVAKPISSVDLSEIESPKLAGLDERQQWMANLAYCQWTLPEMSTGAAWRIIRPLIYG